MELRLARPDDLPHIKQCLDAAFGVYVERMKKKPEAMVTDYRSHIDNKQVYVMDQGSDEISCVLILMPHSDHIYLDTIAISPNHQSKGLGTKMVKFAEDFTIEMGYSELCVCTNIHMHENQRFYSNLGFIEAERKTVNGYDRIYYSKKL